MASTDSLLVLAANPNERGGLLPQAAWNWLNTTRGDRESQLRESHTLAALDADGVVWLYDGLAKEESAARWVRLATARALPREG